MLQVHDLRAGYGPIVALQGVSLRVEQGEMVALVGANGAGKSTLLRAISGLLRPRAGNVIFDGEDVTGRPTHALVALGLSHVPEGRDILKRMTVRENLELGAYQRHDAAGVREDLEAVYSRFPILQSRSAQLAGTLSGGEQQMLAVGRALLARPRLLLLDEPSLGLSPLYVTQVFRLLADLRAEGMTVLLVEQNARQALRYADRAYALETGRIVLEGAGVELLRHPRLQQAYLGTGATHPHVPLPCDR